MRVVLLLCLIFWVQGQLRAQVTCPVAIAALEELVPSENLVVLTNSRPETGKVVREKYRLKKLIEAKLKAESIPIKNPKQVLELQGQWMIVGRFQYVDGPTEKGKHALGEQQWKGDVIIGRVKKADYAKERPWRGALTLTLETKDGKEEVVSIWSRYPEREIYILPAE